MIDINPPKIIGYQQSLRTCIREDYPDDPGDLPLSGGWGYSREDAIIIHGDSGDFQRPDAIYRATDLPELLVELRIYYELVHMRAENDRFSGIQWKMLDSQRTESGEVTYEFLRYEVTAHREVDYQALKRDWDAGRTDPEWSKEEHLRIRMEWMRRYEAEYWFRW